MGTVSGRLRVVDRRFHNDNGWWAWRGISDFAAVAYVLTGREGELASRFDAYARAGRTIVRIMGMLGTWAPDLNFSPNTAGYWEALDHLVWLANRRGLYVELCAFADAQVVVPDAQVRAHWVTDFTDFTQDHPGVILQLANEPFKNGWSEADDPALLALAGQAARELGHKDFSIGDPVDGDDPDASAETVNRLITLSYHSNLVVLHSSRKEDTARFRRWVDHLEGVTEILPKLQPGVALVHDEPMGAGARQPGKRDNDPDALLAAMVCSTIIGCGYTYHWIPEEHAFDPAALPGLDPQAAAVLSQLPTSPDWRYLNDSWAGSPTQGITWWGQTGKLRHLVKGNQAWSLAYGEGDFNSVQWRPGWTPRVVYRQARICIWAVNQ